MSLEGREEGREGGREKEEEGEEREVMGRWIGEVDGGRVRRGEEMKGRRRT